MTPKTAAARLAARRAPAPLPGSPEALLRFGELAAKTRADRGAKQTDAADAAGLNAQHLSGIENGRRAVSRETAIRLAESYGADPVAFLRATGRIPLDVAAELAADDALYASVASALSGASTWTPAPPASREEALAAVQEAARQAAALGVTHREMRDAVRDGYRSAQA